MDVIRGVMMCGSPANTGNLLYISLRDCVPVLSRTMETRVNALEPRQRLLPHVSMSQKSALAIARDAPVFGGAEVFRPKIKIPAGPVYAVATISFGVSYSSAVDALQPTSPTSMTSVSSIDESTEMRFSTWGAVSGGVMAGTDFFPVEVGLKAVIEPMALVMGTKAKQVTGAVGAPLVGLNDVPKLLTLEGTQSAE